ncbi:hypothetical protein AAF712_016490 [Marasmius tenuissimus]|uniref:DUF6699 domain-containing protein n=1 Tax=Marasmius tenuissimus TaxID=585030 RepID=A0ABR2Z7I5_9AGAR
MRPTPLSPAPVWDDSIVSEIRSNIECPSNISESPHPSRPLQNETLDHPSAMNVATGPHTGWMPNKEQRLRVLPSPARFDAESEGRHSTNRTVLTWSPSERDSDQPSPQSGHGPQERDRLWYMPPNLLMRSQSAHRAQASPRVTLEDDNDNNNAWREEYIAHVHGHGQTGSNTLPGVERLSSVRGEGERILEMERSALFGGDVHHHTISSSNPIDRGKLITYEQHMQRNGLHGGIEDEFPYRPSTWRLGYSVAGLWVDGQLFRLHSDAKEFFDDTKTRLHPHLIFDPKAPFPPISLDLRVEPLTPSTLIDLDQFATDPPSSYLRLFHKRLPWYIEVQGQRGGITVQDIIYTLHDALTGTGRGGKSPVTLEEYWCGEMGEEVEGTPTPEQGEPRYSARVQVSMSWRLRGQLAYSVELMDSLARGSRKDCAERDAAKAEQAELARGVRRVDWLAVGSSVEDERSFRWIGLRQGRWEMWEIITEL